VSARDHVTDPRNLATADLPVPMCAAMIDELSEWASIRKRGCDGTDTSFRCWLTEEDVAKQLQAERVRTRSHVGAWPTFSTFRDVQAVQMCG
jgi:hypothetical protein